MEGAGTQNRFEIYILAEKCYWYYVREPTTYMISIVDVEKLFNAIKKTDTRNVTWLSAKPKEAIFIVECIDNNVKDEAKKIICKDFITCKVTPLDFMDYSQIEDSKASLEFQLPSALFKNKVTTIKKVAEVFNFERYNTNVLYIKYTTGTSNLLVQTAFDKNNIGLRDNIDPDKIHVLPVNIANIEPFVSTCLSTYINIKFIKDNEIVFTYNTYDGLCIFKMLVCVTPA
jgi:hypothetical protein